MKGTTNCRHVGVWLAVLVVLVLGACQSAAAPAGSQTGKQVKVAGGAYTNVTAAEIHSMLASKDFTLINVHVPFEGNLANTDLSIPYDTIGQNLAKLPVDKNAKLVLYCRSGRMSDMAAGELVKLGYTNVWNLDGGMVAWEEAGFSVQK